uniref:V-SNARE coiled-coil homology domain-containing protein n=1 Tax=Spermophilus dauricus TaxID=99837 RepID=A0A8C9Q1E2_SPEDA
MVRNTDLVAQRGERLELLIDKTENLVDSSVPFKTTSRNLARAICMKNIKLFINHHYHCINCVHLYYCVTSLFIFVLSTFIPKNFRSNQSLQQ